MKIVICGGHFSPAYALIEELGKTPDIKIIFFGRKFTTEGSGNFSAEYKEISRKKIKSRWIVTGRLQRALSIYTLQALAKIPIGFLQSFFYLLLERPRLIVSFGGSLSLSVVLCGWLLGIESITHEQAIIPGLATKINSLFAKKVFVTWPQTKDYFKSGKAELVGNLTRKVIFKKKARDEKITWFLANDKKTIYITGGNQGSHFLNRIAFEWIKKIRNYQIIHQVGTANFKGDVEKAKSVAERNYLACGLIKPEDIGAVLNGAFLIISRSGANTCWEIAILKKPAILIPLPIAAGSEQEKNARLLKKAGLAEVIDQKDLSIEKLQNTVDKISQNYQKYVKNGEIFAKKLPKGASLELAKYITRYV